MKSKSLKQFPVVILAGGLATRLRPLTTRIPKSLVQINDEPFIAHQLRLLKKNQIEHVVLCVGFLGEQIIEYLGDGQKFHLQITYVFDGPKLLGTGGAIKNALTFLDDSFFVLYGDSYLPCHFHEVRKTYEHNDQLGLMTVFKNLGKWDTSNVEYTDGKILTYDKINRTERMHYIDYGLGIFNKKAFESIPDQEPYDLAHLYQKLLKENQLSGHEVFERFYEVGSFNGIKELENYLCAKENMLDQ